MFSSLTTKLAMRKIGISADTFSFPSLPSSPRPEDNPLRNGHNGRARKARSELPPGTLPGLDDDEYDDGKGGWPAWMTVKSLPLTVQPWLSPPPPPIPVADGCPKVGDMAPMDRDRKLTFGGGRRVMVVFLRCVGCAFAQKTFLALRTLANRHANTLTCIAVSHASPAATQKWVDLLGGAWNVQVVMDEDRAVYAAWGLGTGSAWHVLNPSTQLQGWKETGWLGKTVAGAITRSGTMERGVSGVHTLPRENPTGASGVIDAAGEGPGTVMGNKWQEAGAFAVDGRGKVVWGRKATRADDMIDLDEGAMVLRA